jgi:threonine dehydrogenase-like Zn-dependent dehydrogenase
MAEFPWQAVMAQSCGADQTFLSSDDGYEEVAHLTGAKLYRGRGKNRMLLGGFDLLFDVVGTQRTLNDSLRWTRAGGTVVLVGVNLHRMVLDVTPVWYQEVDLLGAVGHDVVDWGGEQLSTFDLSMRWLLAGRIRCEGLVTHHFPLGAYREAFAAAIDKEQNRSVKVVFDLG